MAQKYAHIFFDLDRTLWDFDRNSSASLGELITRYRLHRYIDDPKSFIETYHQVNVQLWNDYRKGRMTKELLRTLRFRMSLEAFGIHDEELARKIGEEYLRISPLKTQLLPHTFDILQYLSTRFSLHIITNGFRETQEIKIKNSRLDRFITSMTTSESVGHNKPRPEIFQHALRVVDARKKESLMIGDDLQVDIAGARDFGIDQVFFNHDSLRHSESVTYEITCLLQLKQIL